MEVNLPDGSKLEFADDPTVLEVAEKIGPGLAKAALTGRINGEDVDLSCRVPDGAKLEIITPKSPEALEILRHSTAHVMAQALKRLYPDTQFAYGPIAKSGTFADCFYYDVKLPAKVGDEDLPKIEAEMKKIIKENISFVRDEMNRNEGIDRVKKDGQDIKVELIEKIAGDAFSFYTQGEFTDMCRGPHIPSTGKIKCFKLLATAGAYLHGDASREMLTRIYGIAFFDKKELAKYTKRIEEAKARDHRKLGRDLDLFSFHEESPGCVFWHDGGLAMKNVLIDYWRKEHRKCGYQEVSTPIILRRELWETSGHWENYRENMYTINVDDEDFAVKPMNCPGGMLLYKMRPHSYRELPIRMGELGQVHRHELSGALSGLFRVRTFTQDDAHIFMMPEQISDEILGVMALIDKFYTRFGLEYHVELSTRPEKSIGSDEQWEMATNGLRDALDRSGRDYIVNEGDGAFYGPKIDFHVEDCLGRTWQCGTIQLDMSLPERFDLTYKDKDDTLHRPVMIHRVVYGSLDRFLGIIIEHTGGSLPLWVAPLQIIVLSISEKHADYAESVRARLEAEGFRVTLDTRSEKIGRKIRDASGRKAPYVLIVGDREKETDSVGIRKRGEGDIGAKALDEFIADLNKEIE